MHTYLRNCDVLQFCQTLPPNAEPSASRKTVFFLGGTGVNFVTNATLNILKVEIPVMNFASNLNGILTAGIRVVNACFNKHNSDFGKGDFGRDATRITGQ